MGRVEHLLQMGLKWDDDNHSLSLSQARHIDDMASTYGQKDCKPVSTPMEHGLHLTPAEDHHLHIQIPYRALIGSLWWIARVSRPDIQFAVMYMSKFCNCYGPEHFKHLVRILRFLVTTQDDTLTFTRQEPGGAPLQTYGYSDHERFPDEPMLKGAPVEAQTDTDWAGDPEDRRSVSGHIVYLYGNPVSWGSHKQTTVALSSAEAEYYGIGDASKESLHVSQLLTELLPDTQIHPVPMHVDNKGAGLMAEKMLNNKRNKHIDIRYHFIRHHGKNGVIELFHVPTQENVSDIMTKALPVVTFRKLRRKLVKCS